MHWLKSNWHWALYAATALNYTALIAAPVWLGRKLGCAVFLPDLSPFFSADHFKDFRDCLASPGKAGVELFGLMHTFGADLAFPTLCALSLITLTLGQARNFPRYNASPAILKIALIAFMPIAYALSDYTENVLVWQWLTSASPSLQTTSIAVATTLKFSFFSIALAILFLFLLAKLQRRQPS